MPDFADRSLTNPFFSDQPFKIGLFAYSHQGGMTLTKAENRWQAKWDDIAEMARIADKAGLDYLIPLASWKGWRSEVDHRRVSYETLTHAAALSGITKRIGLVCTVHAPLVHPVFAAKALTTIDHASHGRVGLNIVCGWNQADFDMFGVENREHDDRYAHGGEWYEIVMRILTDGGNDFDHDGPYFPGLKNLSGEPASFQRPHPAMITATYSPAGRAFAARTSDILLTSCGTLDRETMEREVRAVRESESAAGRTGAPMQIVPMVQITCRETRAEAERDDYYFSVEMADKPMARRWTDQRDTVAAHPDVSYEARLRGAAGGGQVVGSPEDVVETFVRMHKAGYSGVGLLTMNYLDDLGILVDRVLPLMEQAGLRNPVLEIAG